MTTIIGVIASGHIALAADTLSSRGSDLQKGYFTVDPGKIFHVGESILAIAGPSSTKLAVRDYFSGVEPSPDLFSTEAIYKHWLHLHNCLKRDYFLNPDSDQESGMFESSGFETLIANRAGLYSVTAFRNVNSHRAFAALGTGSPFALGAVRALWRPTADARKCAELSLAIASEFDDKTSPPITSSVVSCSLFSSISLSSGDPLISIYHSE